MIFFVQKINIRSNAIPTHGIGIPAEKFAGESWTSVTVIEGNGGLKLATRTSGEFLGGVFNRLNSFHIGASFHNFCRERKGRRFLERVP